MPSDATPRRARMLALALAAVLSVTSLAPAAAAGTATTGVAPTSPIAVTAGSLRSAGPLAAAKKGTRPVVRLVPGDRRMSLVWPKVRGAKKYTVQLSTSKSFTKKKTRSVSTSRTEKSFTKLKRKTTYYVRVRASKGVTSSWSKVRKAVTTTSSTGRQKATVTPAGTHKVKVSWPALSRGTSVTIVGSYTYAQLTNPKKSFTIKGIPPTRTSMTVTIPASFRTKVGSGSGNPVYIRVTTHNGVRKNLAPIVYSWASPAKPTGPSAAALTFATYNVANREATQGIKGQSWAERRVRVGNAIRYAKADVVALQEATSGLIPGTKTRHYQDIAGLLRKDGYRMALSDAVIGTTPQDGGTKGAHLLVRTDRVSVVDGGVVSLRAQARRFAPNASWTVKDRFFTWALLRNRATGGEFYAVSVHLESGSSAATQKVRQASTAGLLGFMDATMASAKKPSLPLVVLGDLNSDVERYPSGPQTSLVAKGFVSAAATSRASGLRWGTTNLQEQDRYRGFRTKPYAYTYVGTRIDHIFVRNGAGVRSYTNQVVLDSAGRFIPAYVGSDHNLQKAVVQLPR